MFESSSGRQLERPDTAATRAEHIGPAVVVTSLTVLALVAALLLLVRSLAAPLPATAACSDAAVIEIYTSRACHGSQLLGPYSRYGFHHPGPAMFYALAPFYALGKHSHAALCLGALVWNLLWLAALPLVAVRAGRPGAAIWTCVAAGLFTVFLQPSLLLSVWNPYLSMVPFATGVVAGMAAASGRTAFLPLAVGAASLAVQCHVEYALPLLAAVGVGVVIAVFPRASVGATGRPGVHIAAAALVALAMWLPPLGEQLTSDAGNIGRLLSFMWHATPGHTFADAATEVGWRASAFLVLGRGGQDQLFGAHRAIAFLLTALQVVLLAWGVRRSFRSHDRFAAALCLAGLVLLGAAVLAARAIADPFFDHLVRWIGAIGLINTIALAAAFSGALRARLGKGRTPAVWIEAAVCAALLLPVAFVGVRQVVRYPDLAWHVGNAWWSAPEDTLGRPVLAALARERVSHPHLRIVTQSSWFRAAGVVNSLLKAGVPVTVPEQWTFMFGAELAYDGDDGLLLVGSAEELAPLSALPGVRLAAQGGDTRVLLAGSGGEPLSGRLGFGEPRVDLYLRGGFFYPERDGDAQFRWSDGASSRLSLPLVPATAHRMILEVRPISIPGEIEALSVELNGRLLRSVRFTDGGWDDLSFDLPAVLVRATNTLVFRYGFTRSPAEVNGSGDQRQLAVAFRSLTIEPSR